MAIAAEGDVEEGSARECPSLRKAADVDGVALTDEILVDLEQSREGISDESSRESSVEAGTFRMVSSSLFYVICLEPFCVITYTF